MAKFKVYVTEIVRTYYKPVIVEAETWSDATTYAEEMVSQGDVGELDNDTEYGFSDGDAA